MTAFRTSISLIGLAAVAVCGALVTTDMLRTECGVVGRPIVNAWAGTGVFGGAVLLAAAIVAGFLGNAPTRRRILIPTAITVTVGWIAALGFYIHQTSGPYPNCL